MLVLSVRERRDLKAWYAWCTKRELHPLAARRHDVALWTRQLAEQPRLSGKAAAPASIARRLSCLSSFYGYGVPLQDIQDAMGHGRPAHHPPLHGHPPTRDRHATYAFAAWLRRSHSDTAKDDTRDDLEH